MKIEAKVFEVNKGNLLAYASVTLGGVFAIKGVKVMNSQKGIFVSMPSREGKDGKWEDICFPITKDFRAELINTVLEAYTNRPSDADESNIPVQKKSKPVVVEEDDFPF